MSIEFVKQPESFVVKLEKEITFQNEAKTKQEIIDLIREINQDIIFDMARVNYIDSTGMGMIVYFNRYVKEQDFGFALQNVSNDVMEIIELGDFQTLLNII